MNRVRLAMNRKRFVRVLCLLCLVPIGQLVYAEEAGATGVETEGIVSIASFLESCPDADELAMLQTDFPVLFEPTMRLSDPVYSCLEPTSRMRVVSDQYVLIQALRVIRHMTLGKPLPWTDLHPYEWLKSKIGAIAVSYTAQFNSCCHTVFPVSKPEGVQAITLQKASDDLLHDRTQWRAPSSGTGLGNLILLIFHEARHIDLPHNCGSNDTTLAYMGAWGVQITMARYLVEGWIDIGLPGDELPYLAWLADHLEDTRLCEDAP